MIEKREKKVYASHRQFYIEDADNFGDTASSEFWTERASNDLLAIVPGTIGIGTATYGYVLVKMEAHDSPPEFDGLQWDHGTEASLNITQGRLQIVGCLDDGNEELFKVKPGHYRVRCYYANLNEGQESGEGGDWYLVQFWLSEPGPPQVLKRWKG